MKKVILFFLTTISIISFSDTYLEDHLEDILEDKYLELYY